MIDDNETPRHWVEAEILNEWNHSPSSEAWKNYEEFGWNLTPFEAREFLERLPENALVHVLVKEMT